MSNVRAGGADFTRAELDGANLGGGRFDGASFREASLEGARLSGGVFAKADFRGASLDGADIRGVDLSTARGLRPEQLEDACGDSSTRLPKGLAAGGCGGRSRVIRLAIPHPHPHPRPPLPPRPPRPPN